MCEEFDSGKVNDRALIGIQVIIVITSLISIVLEVLIGNDPKEDASRDHTWLVGVDSSKA